jgi:hypothetical protein
MRLNQYALDRLSCMYLSSERREKLTAHLEKYVMPRSTESTTTWEKVSNLVKYAASRIFNALKACFGRSDWQLAKRLFQEEVYSKLQDRNIDLNDRSLGLFNRIAIFMTINIHASAQLKSVLQLNSFPINSVLEINSLSSKDKTRLRHTQEAISNIPDTWDIADDIAHARIRFALNHIELKPTSN